MSEPVSKHRQHTWSQKTRPDQYNTMQRCWDCGIWKIGRHENGKHWIEFKRDGKRIECEATPPCVAPPAATSFRQKSESTAP